MSVLGGENSGVGTQESRQIADAWQLPTSREQFLPALVDIVRGYNSRRPLGTNEICMLPLFLEEVEKLFMDLGRAIGNEAMESGVAEVMAWLVQHRTASAQALNGI